MSVATFQFVLISGGKRTVRKIVAHSTFEATCTGIRTCQLSQGPVKITCKPIERRAA
jgi:hypothetical protein